MTTFGKRVGETSWSPFAARKTHLTWVGGYLTRVEGELMNAQGVQRQNAGGATAPAPVAGMGMRTLTSFQYDAFGNVTKMTQGPEASPLACTEMRYEALYQQLPASVIRYSAGCGGVSLRTRFTFDRGFAVPTMVMAPSSAMTTVELDAWGRPARIFAPEPDAVDPTFTTHAATVTHHDAGPLPFVDVTRSISATETIRFVSLFNGLNEPVLSFDQSDTTPWIVRGWTERNAAGAVEKTRTAWTFTGDPEQVALTASSPAVLDTRFVSSVYDNFGRNVTAFENTPNSYTQLYSHVFRPLSVETRDAEQLDPGSAHSAAYSEQFSDGHGRVRRVVEHTAVSSPETTIEYTPAGEPRRITRVGGSTTYERTMEFDTFGRLVANFEPNTSKPGSSLAWRYVWDVPVCGRTFDARLTRRPIPQAPSSDAGGARRSLMPGAC